MIETPYKIKEEVIFDSTPSVVEDIFVSPTTGNVIYEVETQEDIPFMAFAEARELKKRNVWNTKHTKEAWIVSKNDLEGYVYLNRIQNCIIILQRCKDFAKLSANF